MLEPARATGMSAPKRGLGRGLGALLGDAAVPVSTSHEVVREIPVTEITPNPFQPRKSFDARARSTSSRRRSRSTACWFRSSCAAATIGYELIAGERRWRACAALLRPTIPAIVRASDDRQTLEFAIVENLQRENLNPLEEAAGLSISHRRVRTDARRARAAARQEPPRRRQHAAAARIIRCDQGDARRRTSLRRTRASAARRAGSRSRRARAARGHRRLDGPRARASDGCDGATARPSATSRALSPEERDFESRLRERFGTHVVGRASRTRRSHRASL